MTNRKKSGFGLCLSFMWLVMLLRFLGVPMYCGLDTRDVLAEPCRVDACSGGPTVVGHVLAPVHACWGILEPPPAVGGSCPQGPQWKG